MTRYLLTIFICSMLGHSSPAMALSRTSIEINDIDVQDVTITVLESTIRVSGANGQMMYVYNLAGVRVAAVRVDSSDKHFDLNLSKGCYIVKIGRVVRKVAIR